MSRFMINNGNYRYLIALLTTVFISGCATISQPQSNQVKIASHTFVTLPTLRQLGYSLTANQLITATWHQTSHQLYGSVTSHATGISARWFFIMGISYS